MTKTVLPVHVSAVCLVSNRLASYFPAAISFGASLLIACAISALSTSFVLAVEVVEGEPAVVSDGGRSRSTRAPRAPGNTGQSIHRSTTQSSAANNVSAEMYIELQTLKNEVMQLRGQLEEQGYLIEQLQQRRMDDYIEIDRRIGELSERTAAGAAKTSAATKTKPTANSTATAQSSQKNSPSNTAGGDDKTAYRAAYQMVKDRQFDGAKSALNAFVADYPSSSYVPNSHFWLGELYYLDSSLEKSRQSFSLLVTNYPEHRKVADAKFKLGKIYHQLGDNKTAKKMLESVVNDHADSKAANPAREYLNNSLQ